MASKAVRNQIVFGQHDLARRPPFPRIDLILCRNVLIYFAAPLQRRALEIFAFSLREGGVLVLGNAESPGPVMDAFGVIDRRLRIYRRQGLRPTLPPAQLPTSLEVSPARGTPPPRSLVVLEKALLQATEDSAEARSIRFRAEELIRQLPVGIATVNRHYDVETINGVARELLGVHGIAIGQDLIHLAQQVPPTLLRQAIEAALANCFWFPM
jgi:two-component system CheB/CheR fusion protein